MGYTEFRIVETRLREAEADDILSGGKPHNMKPQSAYMDTDAANASSKYGTPIYPAKGAAAINSSDIAADINPSDISDSDKTDSSNLKAGPPYPPEQTEVVKAMQSRLEELGYSVGVTGIDGKYGPRTSRAVAAFMKDNNITSSDRGRSISAADLEKLKTAKKVDKPSPTGNNTRYDPRVANGDPNFQAPGYPPEMTRGRMEEIIRAEAQQRGIDPDIAVRIFRAEGASAYQSTVPRSGRGSLGGREASFGPFQLYIGGGLGNEYQDATGRDLTTDNTPDGIENQIRFALDSAARNGWGAWYGRGPAGVAVRQGLDGARAIRNWS